MSQTSEDALLRIVRDAIEPAAERIADTFYSSLMLEPSAQPFLTHTLVEERLRGSMIVWIRDLFAEPDPQGSEEFRERQAQVGLVHARIDIPLSVITHGMAILKRECCRCLEASDLRRDQLIEAFLVTTERLDLAVGWINESYLTYTMSNERNDQALRLHVINHNLAIECERLRSGLFDWMRRTVMSLYGEPYPTSADILKHRELDLWIVHKAELFFRDLVETQHLKTQVGDLNRALDEAVAARAAGLGPKLQATLAELNEIVSQCAWLLSSLVEHALEGERVRDPLTRVLSRRYLPSVLQREVKLSLQSGVPFAVFMVDVDRLKELNDHFGHATGDTVLSGIGEALLSAVRANDFVFRYGGDEFMLVVGHVQEAGARIVGENIRRAVDEQSFDFGGLPVPGVSVSIGYALHDGHPDYNQVIQRADARLLEAKGLVQN